MKRIICMMMIALLANLHRCEAQILRSYGAKVAVTSAALSFNYNNAPYRSESGRKIGFNVGAFAEWFNERSFSFMTQLEYA